MPNTSCVRDPMKDAMTAGSLHSLVPVADNLRLKVRLNIICEQLGIVVIPGRHLKHPAVLDLLAQVQSASAIATPSRTRLKTWSTMTVGSDVR